MLFVFKRLKTTIPKEVLYIRKIFRSNLFYVYILECADQTFYTGMTNWLERRMEEHQEGKDYTKYTVQRLPIKLVYYEWHQYVWNAIRRETQIKNWSQAKKIALINGRFDELKKLSRCQNRSHFSNVFRDKPNYLSSSPPPHTLMHMTMPTGSSNGFRENATYFLCLKYAHQIADCKVSKAG